MSRQNGIIGALIGSDPDLMRAYDTNPEFRSGMELLARVLPRFVALMAEEAASAEEARRRMIHELERTIGPGPGSEELL